MYKFLHKSNPYLVHFTSMNGASSAAATNSTAGTRLYLVHYGQPIPQPGNGTRGGAPSKSLSGPQLSDEAYAKAAHGGELVAQKMRGTTWEMRKIEAAIPDSYIQPIAQDEVFYLNRIAMQWTPCDQEDIDTMKADCPAERSMKPYYKFLHLNEHKLKVDPQTNPAILEGLVTGEWKIGTTDVGISLQQAATNYVLLTDTQFRCLNGAVLSQNSYRHLYSQGKIQCAWWLFLSGEFDSHGMYPGHPLELAIERANWSDKLNELRSLKFSSSEVKAEKNEDSGEMEVVKSGNLNVQAGTKRAEISYTRLPKQSTLFEMDGMWMVSIIEIPTLMGSREKTYNFNEPCVFCLDAPSTCRTTTCFHYFACSACLKMVPRHILSKCPACRAPVSAIVDDNVEETKATVQQVQSIWPDLELVNKNVKMRVVTRTDYKYDDGQELDNPKLGAEVLKHLSCNTDETTLTSTVRYKVLIDTLIYVQFKNGNIEDISIQATYWPSEKSMNDADVKPDEDDVEEPEKVLKKESFITRYPLMKDPGEAPDCWEFKVLDAAGVSTVRVVFEL